MVLKAKYIDIVLPSDETIFPSAFPSIIGYSRVLCRWGTPFIEFGIFSVPGSDEVQATLYQFLVDSLDPINYCPRMEISY